MSDFELNAETRLDAGKGASRRLRRTEKVPGIIYGGGLPPVAIVVGHHEVLRNLAHEAFYSHILTVKLNGVEERAVLKDVQRHPWRHQILHLDLQRVNETEKLRMHVPLHFINGDIAPGVKQGGGIVSHLMIDVEVSCLPKDLPEFIEADLAQLQAGESVHLSNLKLPAGVAIVALSHGPEHDLPVASIHIPRGAETEATPATPAAPAA